MMTRPHLRHHRHRLRLAQRPRHPEEHRFRGQLDTARTLAYLRFADAVTDTVARLTTGAGGLTPRRTGFAPAGRQTKFHGLIASSNPPRPALPGRTIVTILGLGNELIVKSSLPANDDGEVRCRQRLGGLLKYYYREAA